MVQAALTSETPVSAVSGLVGMSWFANSTGATALLRLENGTYSYVVSSPGYQAVTGGFSVAGVATTVPVMLSSTTTYAVTFTEAGLPTGAMWYVNSTSSPAAWANQVATIAGSSGTQIVVSVGNDTYPYTVQTNQKNYSTTPTGSITVSGSAKTVSVSFTSTSAPPSSSSSGLPIWVYAGIGVVIAAVVVGVVIALLRHRRPPVAAAPPPPPPPPSNP